MDDPSQGTIYIITGGAGAMTYIGIANLGMFCSTAKGSKVCSDQHHFVRVRVKYNKLHVEVWATKQQTLSYSDSNRRLIDEFDIVKPLPSGNNPCTTQAEEVDQAEAVDSEGSVDQGEVLQPDEELSERVEEGPSQEEYLEDMELLGESLPDSAQQGDEIKAEWVEEVRQEVARDTTDSTKEAGGDKEQGKGAPSGGCVIGWAGDPGSMLMLVFLMVFVFSFFRRKSSIDE